MDRENPQNFGIADNPQGSLESVSWSKISGEDAPEVDRVSAVIAAADFLKGELAALHAKGLRYDFYNEDWELDGLANPYDRHMVREQMLLLQGYAIALNRIERPDQDDQSSDWLSYIWQGVSEAAENAEREMLEDLQRRRSHDPDRPSTSKKAHSKKY